MSSPRHIIPLEDLLQLLRAEGFVLGVEAWQQVTSLLENAAKRGDDLPRIRLKLAALLATSPEEQQRFYRLFDEYLGGFVRQASRPAPPRRSWWSRYQLAISMWGLFLLLAGAFTIWYIPRYLMAVQADFELIYDEASLQVIARDQSRLITYPPFFRDSIIHKEWVWEGKNAAGDSLSVYELDPQQQKIIVSLRLETMAGRRDTARLQIPLATGRAASLNAQVEDYQLKASASRRPLQLSRWRADRQKQISRRQRDSTMRSLQGRNQKISLDSLKSESSFSWDLGDGNRATGSTIQHRYSPADSGIVVLRLFSERLIYRGDSLYTQRDTQERSLNIPKIDPIPPVPVSKVALELPDINDLRKPERDYFLLLILTLLAQLVYGLYEFIRSRREKLVLETMGERSPPLQQHLEVELPDTDLFRSEAFDQAATELRARRLGEAEELDVPATIEASIEQAGLPDFRHRFLEQSSQYLVLVDQQHSRDHQARLYQDLVQELNERDISAALYYYRSDPSLCWKNPLDPTSQIPLNQLQNLYAGERLIVIGPGDGWLDLYSGAWPEWTEVLHYWPEKALLSTKATELWTRAERTLAERFVLLPATEVGLQQLVEQWQADEPRSPREWQYAAFEYAAPAVDRLQGERLIEELRAYLGPERFQWLCACALYPKLYYELSLQLGERILGATLGLEASGHLFRLPWFQRGQIPEQARPELVQELSPQYAQLTRAYLLELLSGERNQAPAGSFAEQEQQSTMAIYRYLNSERTDEDLALLREALKGMEPEDFEDQLSLQKLKETPQSPLAIVLPRSFFKGQNRFFGTRWQAREGILLGILAMMWGLFWLNDWWGERQAEDDFVRENQIVLSSVQDSIRWYHYQGVLTDSLAFGYDSASYWFQQSVSLEARDEATYFPYRMAHARTLFNEMQKLYQDSAFAASEARSAFFAISLPVALSEQGQAQLQAATNDRTYLIALNQLYQKTDSSENLAVANMYQYLPTDYFHTDSLNAFSRERPLALDRLLSKLTDLWQNNPLIDHVQLDSLFVRLGVAPPVKQQDDSNNDEYPDFVDLATTSLLQRSHIVKEGETLYSIAIALKETDSLDTRDLIDIVSDIVNLNKLEHDELRVGMELLLPLFVDNRAEAIAPSDSLYLSGYVGWQLEARIPVPQARISIAGQQTTTNDSGRYALWVPIGSAPRSLEVRRKDFAVRSLSISQSDTDSLQLDTIRISFDAAPPQMVDIPAGSFMMGAAEDDASAEDDEKPAHPVKLSAYQIGRYEVTVAQYLTFVEKTKFVVPELNSQYGNFHPDQPIIDVSWEDAQAYISWLNQTYGRGYRLPTEAEWEYAARGGQNFLYAGSDNLAAVGWYYSNAEIRTHVVGQKIRNGYGLYDMSGNVSEWCQDWYGSDYYSTLAKQDTVLNPSGPESADDLVLRGGSLSSYAEYCRVFGRGYDGPSSRRSSVIGFRLARTK